jgi:hypothetical protein
MKKIFFTISLAIFLITQGSVVFAQTSGSTPDFECKDVGSPSSSGFYVILEEPIAIQEDKNNNFCFRVCPKLTPEEVEKQKTSQGGTTNVPMRVCVLKEECAAESDWSDYSCQRVQVMKSNSGTELVYNYVGMIYKWAAATVGIVAVLTMVISGLEIMSSSDSSKMEAAKGRIMQALVGLVVLFLSGLILYTINPTFFV